MHIYMYTDICIHTYMYIHVEKDNMTWMHAERKVWEEGMLTYAMRMLTYACGRCGRRVC